MGNESHPANAHVPTHLRIDALHQNFYECLVKTLLLEIALDSLP
jgi:hypothetical protein